MNEIKNVKELNENEIAEMIYDAVNKNWMKFPNIWKHVTIDDMATQVALDLYRPRKADGVPHIVHYYNTKGERSLKSLINTVAYFVLVAEARDIHSTGVFDNDARRNVYSAVSLETPISYEDDLVLGDIISDERENVSKSVDYEVLYESIPDVIVDNVYYMYDNNYIPLTYKSLLNDLMNGYNLSKISENLYKKKKNGDYSSFRDLSTVAKKMKRYIRKFLSVEYNYDVRDFEKGWTIL